MEGGYGDRLPSIDTRPPRIRDSDAIIEVFDDFHVHHMCYYSFLLHVQYSPTLGLVLFVNGLVVLYSLDF